MLKQAVMHKHELMGFLGRTCRLSIEHVKLIIIFVVTERNRHHDILNLKKVQAPVNV